MTESLWSIAPIFRGPFLEQVARGTHIPTMLELADHYAYLDPPPKKSLLRDWFDFFYKLLFERYRCEYVYKNAIATKLFLSRHSLQNSLMTDELRSVNSRADVAILNGTSTVYEIKSEYDSLDRLQGQVEDYKKVFDRIYVVTAYARAASVTPGLDTVIGVIGMREDGVLSVVRESKSNKDNTDPAAVFDCMRQSEFCSAVKESFGSMPHVPNSQLYRTAREMFCSLPPAIAHDQMVRQVKRRGKSKPFVDLINKAPGSLKHACVSFTRSQEMASSIAKRLSEAFI